MSAAGVRDVPGFVALLGSCQWAEDYSEGIVA